MMDGIQNSQTELIFNHVGDASLTHRCASPETRNECI